MKVSELVKNLRRVEGRLPIIVMAGDKKLYLSRDFHNNGSKWEQFAFIVDKDSQWDDLDTDFMKAIIDYAFKGECKSLFSPETNFLDYEVCISAKEEDSLYSSMNIEKVTIGEMNYLGETKFVFVIHVTDQEQQKPESSNISVETAAAKTEDDPDWEQIQ